MPLIPSSPSSRPAPRPLLVLLLLMEVMSDILVRLKKLFVHRLFLMVCSLAIASVVGLPPGLVLSLAFPVELPLLRTEVRSELVKLLVPRVHPAAAPFPLLPALHVLLIAHFYVGLLESIRVL